MSFHVVGLGETLWDLLPAGRQLGGAPANFAYHARQLGARADVITRVGNDSLGREALQRFDTMQVGRRAAQIDETWPTGRATVQVGEGGNPVFKIDTKSAWDALEANDEALSVAATADAICFGSLAQRGPRTAAAIRETLNGAPETALIIFDINLREDFYNRATIERSLELADVLKLNNLELATLQEMFGLGTTAREQAERLAERFGLAAVALTRGSEGSALFLTGSWSELDGKPTHVIDTVGAGDAFAAAMAMGLLHRLPLDQIHRLASEVAAYVCGQAGATPLLPQQFRRVFQEVE